MNEIFFKIYLFYFFILFLFTSVILGVLKIGGPCTRSMKGVLGHGPWTRSREGVHGPGVPVLYFPMVIYECQAIVCAILLSLKVGF